MDSTLMRLRRWAATIAAAAALPAFAYNHVNTVPPISPGPFNVACSNVAQDASRIAPGASASDYWEGRDHYISDILSAPQTAFTFNAAVPDQRTFYPDNAGGTVSYVAIVCYPTPASNNDPNYILPGTGDVIPHMQQPGTAPKLIGLNEYDLGFGIAVDPITPFVKRMPLVVYSHGLTGSPISSGYVQVLVELAAQGFMVAAPFHGDPRFSRVRVEDFSDFLFLTLNFDHVVEMQLMRPLSLKAMLDKLLADPGYSPGIDADRIGGFGASLGGEAMMLLLGAKLTTTLGGHCEDAAVHDSRIKAVMGYVPFAGWSFLPAFCGGQGGAAGVNRPFLAMSGTADTTAPLSQMKQALNTFQSSRYMVELVGGQHEFRPEDAGDVFTWMVTFLRAYLRVDVDPGAMGRFVVMQTVTGGRQDNLTVDVHVPFANAGGEVTVRELYNSRLNHYYLATDDAEVQSILAGNYGAGWSLTGQGFKAWPAMPADAFTTVAPVCRFEPLRRGRPYSAFFTADAGECAGLKGNRGWVYTGTPWFIQPLIAANLCPSGYLGVNRAYNQGSVRNDVNHRYTTSDSTTRDMVREGWAYEQMVMCSRP
ncbi:MAG: alpha/beta hydrolase family protein [Usitatibacter sp.]